VVGIFDRIMVYSPEISSMHPKLLVIGTIGVTGPSGVVVLVLCSAVSLCLVFLVCNQFR